MKGNEREKVKGWFGIKLKSIKGKDDRYVIRSSRSSFAKFEARRDPLIWSTRDNRSETRICSDVSELSKEVILAEKNVYKEYMQVRNKSVKTNHHTIDHRTIPQLQKRKKKYRLPMHGNDE